MYLSLRKWNSESSNWQLAAAKLHLSRKDRGKIEAGPN